MKRFTNNLILLFFASALFFALADSTSAQNKRDMRKAKSLVSQGDKLFNKREYKGAIDKYTEAISLVDNYAYAHFWKGNAYYYLKQYDVALDEINIAQTQGYTPLIDLYRIRWYLNYTQGKYDDAISDLNNALQIEPNNVAFKAGLGDVYYAKKSYRDALNIYNEIVDQLPNNGNTYYSIANSYYNLGETELQKTAAEKAVQNGTQFMSDAYFLIGKAYQKNRKYAEAASNYERSINVKRDNYDTYRSLSDVYRNLNRFKDAVQITKKALEEYPRDGNLYTDLAWYYSLADQHAEAVGAAEIAISLLPDKYQAYTYLCRGYNDIKEYQKAIAACNDALKLNPEDGETNFYIGRAYEFSGKTDTAQKFYKKALAGLIEYTQRYPDFADGYYLLGNAYFSNGMKAKAIESYIKSLEFSPDFKKARYNLGYVYIQNGDLSSAEAQYNALLGLDKVLAARLKEAMPKK
ncbi:MAG: tetratricopeptide repeat protein [Pyrinomonadaceae bacterium]|nr:tetratricopeptide repeat protein [Pyrinomonadaceae bacterium]